MRVTLLDGRQMTGQMLAFDKVRIIHALYTLNVELLLTSGKAHERRSRRHRRVSQDQEAKQARRPRRRRLGGANSGPRGEAHPGFDDRARKEYRLSLRRVATPCRPQRASGKVYDRRHFFDIDGWSWRCAAGWPWCCSSCSPLCMSMLSRMVFGILLMAVVGSCSWCWWSASARLSWFPRRSSWLRSSRIRSSSWIPRSRWS